MLDVRSRPVILPVLPHGNSSRNGTVPVYSEVFDPKPYLMLVAQLMAKDLRTLGRNV